MITPRRVYAAVNAPRQVMGFVKVCSVIVTRMTGNPDFPDPPVLLTDVEDHIDELAKAEEHAHKGPKGAAQERNVKLGVVRADMRLLREYVQSVCERDMSRAAALIEGAGMSVQRSRARAKEPFAVKHGKAPGTLKIQVKAIGRGAYYWQMSTDQASWASLPDTYQASTTVSGLTEGTIYYFRFRTLSKHGLSAWSDAVAIRAR